MVSIRAAHAIGIICLQCLANSFVIQPSSPTLQRRRDLRLQAHASQAVNDRIANWVSSGPDGVTVDSRIELVRPGGLSSVLARYFASTAAGKEGAVVCAPDLVSGTEEFYGELETLLQSSSNEFKALYSPTAEKGPSWAPYLSIRHDISPAVPARDVTMPEDTAVMDSVFLWLQRQLLSFEDESEDEFVILGRKLLSVSRYVVTPATSTSDLTACFWEQAARMQEVASLEAMQKLDIMDDPEDSERKKKEASADEDNATSVLLCVPGLADMVPGDFSSFFIEKLSEPLSRLSAKDSTPLVAECWVGGGLEFPVILLSPPISAVADPEGGYKVYTTAGGEVTVDEYIAQMEAKLEAEIDAEKKRL